LEQGALSLRRFRKGIIVMCEATAYFLKDGKEEKLLEGVDQFESGNGEIRLINIFGEENRVRARIKRLSLVEHKIILEPIND
jgi:predicted RNA-binding protein